MDETLKAKLIVKTKTPSCPTEIYNRLNREYSYNWVRQKLDDLNFKGIIEKSKGGTGKKGNKVYYTADSEDVEKALQFLKGEREKIDLDKDE